MNNIEKYIGTYSPCYVIEIYNNGHQEEMIYGNREVRPTIKKCNRNTLFDISSITKVYTAVLIFTAYEEGKLDIYDYVKTIDSRFSKLYKVRVVDLLSHNQEVWTDGYLGDAKNKEEFYKILFSARVIDNYPTYVDVHYIILSTILEKIYNKFYPDILEEKILKKLNLTKTTTNPKGDNIASSNYETIDGKILDNIYPGVIRDTKARTAKSLGITTGHSSIFTTGSELLKFMKSFFDNSLLSLETIKLMLYHRDRNQENYAYLKKLVPEENDINKMYEKALRKNPKIRAKVLTYNNMSIHHYNNIDVLNDIPSKCSQNTIALSGYPGSCALIDFDKKIIIIIMCNAIHSNKLTHNERKDYKKNLIQDICDQVY